MENSRFFPEVYGNFGFGCMRLPMKGGSVDYEEFCRMADAFIEAGFNHILGAFRKRRSGTVWQSAIPERNSF